MKQRTNSIRKEEACIDRSRKFSVSVAQYRFLTNRPQLFFSCLVPPSSRASKSREFRNCAATLRPGTPPFRSFPLCAPLYDVQFSRLLFPEGRSEELDKFFTTKQAAWRGVRVWTDGRTGLRRRRQFSRFSSRGPPFRLRAGGRAACRHCGRLARAR